MSGLNGQKVTHDPSERLSYLLAAEISSKRPGYALAQANMKETCAQCHTRPIVDRIYEEAEQAVASTNEKIKAAKEIYEGLRADKVITGRSFRTRSISSTSICGTITGALPSTAPLWAAKTRAVARQLSDPPPHH